MSGSPNGACETPHRNSKIKPPPTTTASSNFALISSSSSSPSPRSVVTVVEMKPQSLLASAGINIGLAMVVLSLFSIFKKQPLNAVVYYPRRLARGEEVPPLARATRGFSFFRLRPSVSWIPRAFRVTEDEILRQCGLDALAVIRLFKLG
ncbi:hypothetical protein Taro_035250 [Colocasia esculenta]|uniref:CSC1/OSCA1-like N-terminal transmembrane domain-containing protein n=1 Tax=Colocasia esculenta TaxID=4460 RepID=A0A843W390_COLES|nr:hypothetical protein [Colocasia esculenta]